jgi:hypothetical protein
MLSRGVLVARPFLGVFALFSGVALLLNIILQVDLRLGLAVVGIAMLAAFGVALRRASGSERRSIVRTIGYGAVAGVLATLAYDVVRVALTEFDPSPYKPFEAMARFGQLLLATEARDSIVILAGGLYHILNGMTFGVAFTLLFMRDGSIGLGRAFLLGSGWGIFLEIFQLTLYPDWLGIKYLNEFVTISASGHLAYGATLAVVGRGYLRRASRSGRGESGEGRTGDG